MAQQMHPLAMQSYTALAAVALSVLILFMADGSGIAGLDPAWPSTFAILMIFDDIPTPTTMFGVAIIIASGLYVLTREQKNNVASGPNLDAI